MRVRAYLKHGTELLGKITTKQPSNMKTILFFLALIPIMLTAQVDTTLVAVDTSEAVKLQAKYEISRSGQKYTIRQFQDESTFVQTEIQGKRAIIERLTQILRQLNADEALLVRQLAILRERKKEIRAARELYK